MDPDIDPLEVQLQAARAAIRQALSLDDVPSEIRRRVRIADYKIERALDRLDEARSG